MNILKKCKEIKSNLKDFAKETWGKGVLSLTALGLGLSFFSLEALSSINFGFVLLYIFALAFGPISLLVGMVGLDKLRSEDSEKNSDLLMTSTKILGFGFASMIISYLLKFDYTFLTHISFLSLFAGVYGIDLFVDKNFVKEMRKIKEDENRQNATQIEKLPLRLNLKEEEQELGLTNYFKK